MDLTALPPAAAFHTGPRHPLLANDGEVPFPHHPCAPSTLPFPPSKPSLRLTIPYVIAPSPARALSLRLFPLQAGLYAKLLREVHAL